MSYFPKNARDIPPFIVMHFFLAVVIFGAYAMLVWAPVVVWTERECLAAGYPKAEVTITLDRYCLDLVGGTARVDALSKVKRAPVSNKPEQN